MLYPELSIGEYLLMFSDARNAFSDACVQQASECGRMYCEKSENVYRGFVCTAIENAEERILYAYTKPEYRRKGVFTALAEHVIRTSTRGIRVSIPEKHPCFEAVDAVCARLGFRPTDNLHTYSFDSSQKAAWQRVKAARRFDTGCARLQRRGCGVVSFAEADEGLLPQIRDSHSTAFRNPLDPSAFFRHPSKKLSMELSFAAVKEGRLLAYTLYSQPSRDAVVLEQMAASADARGSGAILLPLVRSVDRFFESGYAYCFFAIYEHNTAPNLIRAKLGKETSFEMKVTHNYRRQAASCLTAECAEAKRLRELGREDELEVLCNV